MFELIRESLDVEAKMGTKERAALVGGIVVALAATGGMAAADPAPTSLKVIATGSGCPNGTFSADTSGGEVLLRFHGGHYVATVDGDTPAARKACQASLVVEAPAGWQFTLGSVSYRGISKIAYGADATTSTSYYWQGNPATTVTATDLGNNWGSFTATESPDPADLGWSDCGGQSILNVRTSVIAHQGDAPDHSSSEVRVSSERIFDFVWRQCTP
jgi:hypothetical protein